MAEQHLLHLEGGDILATAADGILQAIDKAEITERIAHHTVAGVEPAAAPCLFGYFRHAEVTGSEGELLMGAQKKLTGLVVRDIVILATANPCVEAMDDLAHVSGALLRERAADHKIGLR